MKYLKGETQGAQEYLENLRKSGIVSREVDSKEIAEYLEIEKIFPEKRQRKTTRQFLYEVRDEVQYIPDEMFKRGFSPPWWMQLSEA